MRFPILAAAMAAVFLALPVLALAGDDGASAAKATQNTAANDPDRIVCKSEPIVGSRMQSRICATQREWDQRRKDDQDWLNDFTIRTLQLCVNASC